MRFIVSVVSHGHEKMIINFRTLKMLSSLNNVIVICRDNKPSPSLRKHCDKYGIHYIENKTCKGFAENNNLNFIYYLEEIKMKKDDFFLLMNPDIILKKSAFNKYASSVRERFGSIVTANLFLDADHSVQDHNIRKYPGFIDFISSYLLRKNKTIIDRSKKKLPEDSKFWASGSFLGVSSDNYLKLNGFDESYYMYCEDIDFCRRAEMLGIDVNIVMDSAVVHTRSRDSRKFFSKYFFWHVSGVIKYLLRKEQVYPRKSSLTQLKSMD